MMEEPNLVILSEFRREEIIEPTEQHIFCNKHYEEEGRKYKDFEVSRYLSSMPKIWCEICTPLDWGY